MTAAANEQLQFHGFSASELDRLQTVRNTLSIEEQLPGLEEVEAGTVAPLKYRGVKNSGVYDAVGAIVASSARVRGATRIEGALEGDWLTGAIRDKRSAYYLGAGEKHYGHFLLEVLCRAWAWEAHSTGRVAVIQTPVPPFGRALYRLIPGLPKSIEIVKRPRRFARVLVPGASFVIARKAHRSFRQLCERMAERALPTQSARTAQPLYLSRAGLDPSRRTLVGEVWLEQVLANEGFRIVRPETLTIVEQIALVNRHEWIVSTTGSAAHTRVFSLHPTNFVTVTPALFNSNHMLCDLLCTGASHYINALTRPDIGTDVDLSSIQPLLIDQRTLLSKLHDLGLVRTAAVHDAPDSGLDDYRARWIAAARWLIRTRPPNKDELLQAIARVSASGVQQRRRPLFSFARKRAN